MYINSNYVTSKEKVSTLKHEVHEKKGSIKKSYNKNSTSGIMIQADVVQYRQRQLSISIQRISVLQIPRKIEYKKILEKISH